MGTPASRICRYSFRPSGYSNDVGSKKTCSGTHRDGPAPSWRTVPFSMTGGRSMACTPFSLNMPPENAVYDEATLHFEPFDHRLQVTGRIVQMGRHGRHLFHGRRLLFRGSSHLFR